MTARDLRQQIEDGGETVGEWFDRRQREAADQAAKAAKRRREREQLERERREQRAQLELKREQRAQLKRERREQLEPQRRALQQRLQQLKEQPFGVLQEQRRAECAEEYWGSDMEVDEDGEGGSGWSADGHWAEAQLDREAEGIRRQLAALAATTRVTGCGRFEGGEAGG